MSLANGSELCKCIIHNISIQFSELFFLLYTIYLHILWFDIKIQQIVQFLGTFLVSLKLQMHWKFHLFQLLDCNLSRSHLKAIVIILENDLLYPPEEPLLWEGLSRQWWENVAGIFALRRVQEELSRKFFRFSYECLIKICLTINQKSTLALQHLQIELLPFCEPVFQKAVIAMVKWLTTLAILEQCRIRGSE